ncbi:MAG: protease modulator HflC [Chloroflexi bacterium]|nr:protease modulator HflC [Chloroflexota bacterium]
MVRILLIAVILLAGVFILIRQSLFIVDQTQYAVVTRFGEIQRIIITPGLEVKTPFVEDVTRFDKRLLRIDVRTEPMQDREKQILEIDAYVRYRILDARRFMLSLRDEFNAESRISQIVVSEIRRVVADKDRTDIIGGIITTQPDGTIRVDPKKTPDGHDTREALTREVIDGVNLAVKSAENDFGIEVVDVRIKAADFPTSVEEAVFNRMRTERSVQAQRLRAEGEQQNNTITADVDRQVTIVRAEAERQANQARGEGEAQAIAIFADALEQDPEFYAFQRSLEAYKKFLAQNSTVVLSSEDDLFKYLESPLPQAPAK